jgi:phenylacetate-CoA ligase
VLNAFSYHMVAAGLTFHGGLNKVGATVVPSGSSATQQQVQLIKDLNVTGYTGTPSFLMAIITKAAEMGYDFARDFRVKRASFAAEPLQPSLRQLFETEYGIDTFQMYGATEVGDVAYECSGKKGWHLCEEVIVEIADPATGEPVKPGELGEVVVTRLNHIFFLLRFGTGDLSSIIEEPCPCGRTGLRLSGIAGRVGDAVKVRGMFIAPSQVKRVCEAFPGLVVQLVISRSGHRDNLTARLEAQAGDLLGNEFQARFEKIFQEICTVKLDRVEFLKPGSLTADTKLLVDERTWK